MMIRSEAVQNSHVFAVSNVQHIIYVQQKARKSKKQKVYI